MLMFVLTAELLDLRLLAVERQGHDAGDVHVGAIHLSTQRSASTFSTS